MKNHITCLDGIRGLLAMWVFWGHICIFVGLKMPILGTPALAVDLFMLLSGFLMAYHWESKRQEQDDIKTKITKFWIRRFFRIAPLYYCLLLVALCFGPYFLETSRNLAATISSPYAAAKVAAVTDHGPSLLNVLSHISFCFGFFPQFASSNALPDWSLSLEMQFYLFFPFLMFLMKRSRVLIYILAAVAISVAMSKLFGLYLESGRLGNFPQPSFLPFKIDIFAAGMILGHLASHREDTVKSNAIYWVSYVVCILFISKLVALCTIVVVALIFLRSKPVAVLNKLLSNKVFRFLGDVSYSVYLVHVMLLYVALNQFMHWKFFVESSAPVRFSITAIIITPIVFIAAYGLHKLIELPGIEIGKNLTRRKTGNVDVGIAPEAAL